MQSQKLYIKIEQSVAVSNRNVCLQDIASLYSQNKKMVQHLNRLPVLNIKDKENKKYMFSILKIIQLIEEQYPEIDVINMGENQFIVSYGVSGKKSKILGYLKVVLVCAIISIGSAFSIMTFNTDVSVSDVFDRSYQLVLGDRAEGNGIVELFYSIGLAIGILVFFNHFSKRATKEDPTPLQVELRTYEEDVNKALIQNAAREGKEIDAH